MPDGVIFLLLVLLGIGVATYGTMIGAGGGFVLTPLLLLLYPGLGPEVVTSISLCAVFFNSISGSLAYWRQKRIDFSVALIFAGAEVPGAIAGAFTTELIPRALFEGLFALILLGTAAALVLKPAPRVAAAAPVGGRSRRRMHTDFHGETYSYTFNPVQAVLIGIGIGYISAAFGVGGGFIYVPVMVLMMRFPAYIATATSTFALMFASGGATLVHLGSSHYSEVALETVAITCGVLVGAQVGAFLSVRLAHRQAIIMRLLSAALLVVGTRLLIGPLL